MADGNKVERKYLAHFIDSSFGAETPTYIRLGKDLEEYNIEMNPDVETKQNIIGENSTIVKGYEPSSSVDKYYAYEDDPLFERLSKIINNRETGNSLKTTAVDVLVDSTGEVTWAYKEDVVVIPQSIGGDASGVQIPYEVKYNGNRQKGTWDTASKTFTPETVGE